MDVKQFMEHSQPYLVWLASWFNSRPTLNLARVLDEARGEDKAAVLAVDVTVGFCSQGSLASARVGSIVGPIVRLFDRAYRLGVKHYILPQDTHSEDAVEFGSFPPHCVRGTGEPVTVPQLRDLPFSDQFVILEKDSISSDIGTGLHPWLESHPEVTIFLVVGDCTDLCVYQLAMHLRLWANATHRQGIRVIVPIDGVDTFDTPVELAGQIGAPPHPGDLIHLMFLHHMAQNGIEVVARVE